MDRRDSLEAQIKRRTLPRLFGLMIVVLLGVSLIVSWAIHQNVERQHISSLNVFQANINQQLNSIRGEILSLARNDLMINSLIDFQARDDYLDIFFQSFRLANFTHASLIFYDFEGQVISATNPEAYEQLNEKPDWQSSVLEKGNEFLSLRKTGLVYVVPVFYADLPEGALMVYLPDNLETFASTISGISPDITFRLLHHETSETLFESQVTTPSGGLIAPVSYSSQQGDFRSISYQSADNAYADLYTVGAAVAFIFLLVFIGSRTSIRLTARTASRPLWDLENKLRSLRSSNKHLEIQTDDVSEVVTLKNAYNALFSELDIASKSLADIENVVNSLNDYLLVMDSDEQLILCNQPLRDLFRKLALNNSQLDNQDVLDLIPEKVRKSQNAAFHLECNYGDDGEGHQVFVRWKKQVYRDHSGQEAGILYVGTDTTLAKEIQDELEIKNQAIESAHTSIVITANAYDFPIVYVNAAFSSMTGYTTAEVLGKNCRFLQGPETEPEARKKLRDALRKAEPVSVTLMNYRKNGTPFYNEVTLSPIRNHAGEVTHILGLQADVSEAENTKRFLKDARLKAEESARLKSSFLASMSHEIRTPMNGVLGMLHLLQETSLDAQQTHHVHLAKTSADSLLDIINDILDFSKIEAGKLEIEEAEFNLPEILGDLVKSMSQRANERGDEILLDLSQLDYRYIKSDPSRIKQIASNLLTNAIKFTENGKIHVRARIDNSDGHAVLTLSVKDTGIGISPERQTAVFDSFTQADNSTTRRFGGTGLGLAICKELCEAMNGNITLESEENRGSTFHARIQLAELPDSSKKLVLPDLKGQQVLVVDSSEESAAVLQGTLSRTGAEVRVFHEAETALEYALASPCHLVFLERDLTSMKGPAMWEQLKAHTGEIPKCVLMNDMATNAYPDDQCNADAVFMKPATLDDVITAIVQVNNDTPTEATATAKPALPEKISQIRGKRVLLVEDNPINQLLAKTLLESLQLHVDVAGHGIEALAVLKQLAEKPDQAPYELIFMDCQMPKMDGYETTACIRMGEAGEQVAAIPIIAMTANAVSGDREKCLDAGMDDYLSKPVNVEALSTCVFKWLDKSAH